MAIDIAFLTQITGVKAGTFAPVFSAASFHMFGRGRKQRGELETRYGEKSYEADESCMANCEQGLKWVRQ
jgi:hypothetical protein